MRHSTLLTTAVLTAAGLAMGTASPLQAETKTGDQGQAQQAAAKEGQKSQADRSKQDKSSDKMKAKPSHPVGFLLVVPVPVDRTVVTPVDAGAGNLAPSAEEIRDTVASATEAALTRDGFDDVVERLVDADRNRIGQGDSARHTEMNTIIGRIRDAWKAKYGNDFDIEDEAAVFAPFHIVEGEINEQLKPTKQTMSGNGDEDYNLEPGRGVAVIDIPAANGQIGLTIPMIDEAMGWKIDVPNRISGPALSISLMGHLTDIASNPDKWPADEQAAYRYVSHRVMMALMGVSDNPNNAALPNR